MRPTVFVSTEVPADLIDLLAEQAHLVEVEPGTTAGLARYGEPDGWLLDSDTPVDAAVLDQLPGLRVVSQFGVGYDNVNVPDASARGVVVCNTPGVLDGAVAELTIGMLIAIGRGILGFDRFVRDGDWGAKWPALTSDVHGKTLGIVGMGRIGRRVAEAARGLRMNVLYHNRSRDVAAEAAGLARHAEWEELFRESDFVSVHVPLTERTRGFIGREEFALMKPTAYLVNTARGRVLDEEALIEVLAERGIAGAALDVMAQEPLPAGHPLTGLDNVLLLPHIGSATVETRRAMIELAVRNVLAGARGAEPETSVNLADALARRA